MVQKQQTKYTPTENRVAHSRGQRMNDVGVTLGQNFGLRPGGPVKRRCVSIPCRNLRTGRVLPDEKELFQEAWEAMLWYELFRVEYVTIRDTIESAIVTLSSVGVYL